MASTLEILKRLTEHEVAFIVVGGMAGVAHGSSMVTEDVDVCAPFDAANLSKILQSLGDLHPCHRMNPAHPPLPTDPGRLENFKNLYVITDLGQVDFLSEITGVGPYREVAGHTVELDLAGMRCRVLDLDTLIRSKKALGRPRDIHAVTELEAIRQRIRERPTDDASRG